MRRSFGLGMLQALSAKASVLSALSSQAVVGVYAMGASVLAVHALVNGKASTLKPTDKLCLAGALCGVAAFVGASLSRFGYLPPSSLPLEGIGIALGLTVRALALTPLTREFISCGRQAFDPQNTQHSKSIPSLASHFFWNGAIVLNYSEPALVYVQGGDCPSRNDVHEYGYFCSRNMGVAALEECPSNSSSN